MAILRLFASRRFWRRLLVTPLFGIAVGLPALWLWLCPGGLPLVGSPRDYFLARRGTTTTVAGNPLELRRYGGTVREVRLEADSGLVVDLSVRRPAQRPNRGLPLVLLVGGYRTGRNAVHLVGNGDDMVLAAIDYPLPGSRKLKGFKAVAALPRIRRALYDTPPSLMVALDYLLTLPEVDPSRVELVGVSMGAPLVCAAGALDTRFARVWAVQGGGDAYKLFYHSLEKKIPATLPRHVAARIIDRLVRTISPEFWVAEISPRPFVLVTAVDDERIPKVCADIVFDHAQSPKKRLDLPGVHIKPGDRQMVDLLFDTLRDHMHEDNPPEAALDPDEE